MKRDALNWKAGAVLLLLSAGSFFLPQIFAPFAGIAFLYLLPGYVLIRILRVNLQPLESLAISILASIMVSTHAIYWLSLAFGYSTGTFALFFALVSLSALFMGKVPKIRWRKEFMAPIALAGATCLLVFFVLHFSLWVPSESGVVVGGWNYGDYFIHASIMQSVNHGNFPPQEPIYAGEPLRYHWFSDLHTAIASKLTGFFHSFPATIDSALGVGLLSLLGYLAAFHFTKNRNASLLCALLLVFGGGFGYLRLFGEMQGESAIALLENSPFDNDGEFFQLPSMLPGFLLPQRPLTVGLPALAAVVLLVATGYPRDWRRLLLAGIILGMMPPFQYHAFLSAALLSALYFACHHFSRKSLGGSQNALLFVVLPSLLLALPFLLEAAERAGGAIAPGIGWVAPKGDVAGFAVFYAGNLGLPFLLALPGMLLFRGRERLFLALGLVLMFLIPNLVTIMNSQWDMGKFFMCGWLFLCMFAGIAIARLPKLLWPVVLLACCFTSITGAMFYLSSGWIGLHWNEAGAGEWILANTPEGAVFASSTSHTSPISPLGGRLRILGYEWWVFSYGLDSAGRKEDLRMIYCGPREGAASLMKKYGAEYAYLGRSEISEFGCGPDFGIPGFTLEYSSGGISIYRLRG